MHVHIAWQIYHHQQKVKVSLAFLILRVGNGGIRECDLPIKEAFKQILKTHRQEGSSLSWKSYSKILLLIRETTSMMTKQ